MRRERVVDTGVVLLAAVLALTNALVQLPLLREPFDAVAFGLLFAGAAALWFRRTAPVAVAWFVAALSVTLVSAAWVWPGADPDGVLLPSAVPFAAYAVPLYARRWHGWIPLAVIAAVSVVGAPPQAHLVAVAGQVVALVGGPALLGLYAAARVERLERERDLRADEARRAERLRLAAEIHDVVSHRVSVMVLQAGALQVTAPDEPVRRAAEELRATGCQALDELRDLVGLLTTSGSAASGPLVPLPDLSGLTAAVESVGIAVDLHEVGEPRPLSGAVGRTAYRVVQEALTNVGKHAPGSRVRIDVDHLPAGVRVRVRNTAPERVGDAELAAAGGGTGLLGLRRRIELLHGTLVAEACADGGFLVDVRLPTLAEERP
ncbi:signal transduction histidine kinase [Saccharothrix ecbatanensis]|uniref:histidine kinase n=1 Tax=Saccharothrix ecbatanensis TaxID=1105145 RepID=A0A7W9M597_9PSEU|nr:histidine kinase [Saccharothrix ecbatanensis]MBB5807853.1 signal transduction histidine kinase [Saccharothrix ecbatanensis]